MPQGSRQLLLLQDYQTNEQNGCRISSNRPLSHSWLRTRQDTRGNFKPQYNQSRIQRRELARSQKIPPSKDNTRGGDIGKQHYQISNGAFGEICSPLPWSIGQIGAYGTLDDQERPCWSQLLPDSRKIQSEDRYHITQHEKYGLFSTQNSWFSFTLQKITE